LPERGCAQASALNVNMRNELAEDDKGISSNTSKTNLFITA
jgi:hypothetical protein